MGCVAFGACCIDSSATRTKNGGERSEKSFKRSLNISFFLSLLQNLTIIWGGWLARTGQNFILAWLKVVFSVLFCSVNVDDVLLNCFMVGYVYGWLLYGWLRVWLVTCMVGYAHGWFCARLVEACWLCTMACNWGATFLSLLFLICWVTFGSSLVLLSSKIGDHHKFEGLVPSPIDDVCCFHDVISTLYLILAFGYKYL